MVVLNYSSRRNDKVKLLFIAVILLFVLAGLPKLLWGQYIFVNQTSSAPEGVYIRTWSTEYSYGDYVIIQLAEDIPALHAKKGLFLLKRIAGMPGDTYCVYDDRLELNGIIYPIYRKVGLPSLSSGADKVDNDCYFLLNEKQDSFDSRYFGEIKKSDIVCKVRLLVSFKSIEYFFQSVDDIFDFGGI